MPQKGRLVVLRFSAMGDVAMVASVLHEFSHQNPNVKLIMVSRIAFKPFFDDIPNLIFHAIHPKTTHKGTLGILKLYEELLTYKPFAVADLHNNLRSRLLCTFFRLGSIKIKRIDKGRVEKWALTRKHNKILKPLKQTVERYSDVFRSLGFHLQLSHSLKKREKELPAHLSVIFNTSIQKKIGISPFAQHQFKVYSIEKMQIVIEKLHSLGFQIFIFGGGNEEKAIAEQWQNQFLNVKNLIGKFTLTEELAIISHLDLMLSMDSSGMHMASLMGIPVISVWGPTHPFAGFLGYGQKFEDCIQIDHPSRPNSIYGNKPCLCGSDPCIDLIKPELIVDTITERLHHG